MCMYNENVLTSWLCDSVLPVQNPEGPLLTSYEAMITVTTSDGFGSVSAFHFHYILNTAL